MEKRYGNHLKIKVAKILEKPNKEKVDKAVYETCISINTVKVNCLS